MNVNDIYSCIPLDTPVEEICYQAKRMDSAEVHRNFLIAKYAMLRDIFQPSHSDITCLTIRFLGAAQVKHLSMAQSAVTDLDVRISRQATVEDIITTFVVDQILSDRFPEA